MLACKVENQLADDALELDDQFSDTGEEQQSMLGNSSSDES